MSTLFHSLVLRILLSALLLLIVPAAMARPALVREVVVSEIAWMGTTISANDE